MKNPATLRIIAGMFLLSTTSLLAQAYKIESFVIAGGGGTSTGGVYSVSGTVGQHDAGKMAGGTYALEGGFWSRVTAIQTPGAPLLTVKNQNGSVVVSWPDPSTGYVLQEVGALVTPPASTPWVDFGGNVNTANGEKSATITPVPGARYFRLIKSNP